MRTLSKQAGLRQMLPCEHAVRVVLPSIRSLIARILLNEMGVNRYTIAKILGMSPAAVTFYINGKRGDKYIKKIEETPELFSISRKAAKLLLDSYIEKGRVEYHIYQIVLCSVCNKVNQAALDHGCPLTLPSYNDKLMLGA